MNRRTLIATAATLPAGIALAGCTEDASPDDDSNDQNADGGDDQDNADPTDTTTSQDQYADAYYHHEDTGLVLRDVEATAGDYSITVTGTVENTSDTDYSYAAVTFGLYDDTDAKLGSALDNVSGLDASQRWKFEALGTDTDATTYQLDDVTAY